MSREPGDVIVIFLLFYSLGATFALTAIETARWYYQTRLEALRKQDE